MNLTFIFVSFDTCRAALHPWAREVENFGNLAHYLSIAMHRWLQQLKILKYDYYTKRKCTTTHELELFFFREDNSGF